MNNKFILVTLAILGIIVWFIFNQGVTISGNEEDRAASRTRNHSAASPPKLEAHPLSKKEKEEAVKDAVKKANVPIRFFGMVIDQDGNPLSDVSLVYRIQQPRGMWDSHGIILTIHTDLNGQFHITGDKGSSLNIQEINKKGYKQAKGQEVTFTYIDNPEIYKPDQLKPEIYTLIKETEIPELIHWEKKLFLNWDGKPLKLDLATGKISADGKIKITPIRSVANEQGKLDWSCKVEVIGGGIVETSRSRTSVALETGYEKYWERSYTARDKKWGSSTGITYLHFRQADKKYGYFRLNVSADPRRGKFSGRIKCYYNPSGSRVLGSGIFNTNKKSTND